jgi:hypothetical protein
MMWAAGSGSQMLVILGMAVLGSGGGLLNGETQKAIMGNVPRERAGMASGISTTSRFTGVLAGFAGLGAVLAEAARGRMLSGMSALAGIEEAPDRAAQFVARAMAGDMVQAAQGYGERQAAVLALARGAYARGFAHAFAAAALLALMAAAIVLWSIRKATVTAIVPPDAATPTRHPPAA